MHKTRVHNPDPTTTTAATINSKSAAAGSSECRFCPVCGFKAAGGPNVMVAHVKAVHPRTHKRCRRCGEIVPKKEFRAHLEGAHKVTVGARRGKKKKAASSSAADGPGDLTKAEVMCYLPKVKNAEGVYACPNCPLTTLQLSNLVVI